MPPQEITDHLLDFLRSFSKLLETREKRDLLLLGLPSDTYTRSDSCLADLGNIVMTTLGLGRLIEAGEEKTLAGVKLLENTRRFVEGTEHEAEVDSLIAELNQHAAISSSGARRPVSPDALAQASRMSDNSAQVSLPFAVEDLVLLEVSTQPNPLATLLNVRFGFDHKPLILTRPLGAPVACGCTMAHLFFRIRDPFRLGDEPKSQQLPENSEVTCLLLGALPRIILKIRSGTRFLNGTGAMELEILSQQSLKFAPSTNPQRGGASVELTRSVCTDATIKGNVYLKPEFFQIDWLHDHVTGSYDELKDLRRDLSIHVTALLHKAQRSQKLKQPILLPEVEPDER